MRGLIIIPEQYKSRWTDSYKILLDRVSIEYKFPLIYSDNPDIHPDTDIVIFYATPIHCAPERLVEKLLNLPSRIKTIGYMSDCQSYGKKAFKQTMNLCLERFDRILTPSWEYFCTEYPDHVNKSRFFPNFIAPKERYELLEENMLPLNRCLVSGAQNPSVYPLRDFILKNKDDRMEVILPPYWNQHNYVGANYALLLRCFHCAVTCSSIFKYAVAKYFEIPAAGTLLLAEDCEDVRICGHVPWETFIPVHEDNVLSQINYVLNISPDNGQIKRIKKQSREFVLKYHTVNNRFETFCKVIEEL